ncbi:MAG: Mu-like prophage major head subunit gpT family protein [Dehalococcoidia bacterium]|nr:Mu-like prophage major head subunit gpT family protein [Dehalococcoidia bacterium]
MELMKLMEDWKGYVALSEVKKPEGYEQKLKETVDLLSNANHLPAHRHEYLLREALTTSDFPYLFGDVLDRQVLAAYKAVDPVWKSFVRMGTVPRIYPQVGGYRFGITGGDQYLAEVAEKGEYLASDRDERRFAMYVKKYGRQFDISWEALINDDLEALQDTPERFARAAVRTEHRIVTSTYVADAIADTTHAAGNLYDNDVAGEINLGALPLTIANLENTCEAMAAFTDVNGEPIINRAKYLVVGPGLEFTARQILTSTNKMWNAVTDADGTGTMAPYPMTNVISQYGLQLVIDPYIPIYAPSQVLSWFLFADPRDIAAMECDYLKGHERPEICMKASDKVNIGGGEISPMTGDFATDNVFYRVRDVFGCNKLEWRATYAQLSSV